MFETSVLCAKSLLKMCLQHFTSPYEQINAYLITKSICMNPIVMIGSEKSKFTKNCVIVTSQIKNYARSRCDQMWYLNTLDYYSYLAFTLKYFVPKCGRNNVLHFGMTKHKNETLCIT